MESAVSNQGLDQKPDTPLNEVQVASSCQHTREGISPTQIQGTLATGSSQETGKSAIKAKLPKMKSFSFSLNMTANAKSRLCKKLRLIGEVKDGELHIRDSCMQSPRVCSYNQCWKKISCSRQILYTSGQLPFREVKLNDHFFSYYFF